MIDSPYLRSVLATSNLVALYPLAEPLNTQPVGAERGIGAFSGTIEGTPARVVGPVAGLSAMDFDGVNEAVGFANAGELGNFYGETRYTIEYWMNIAAVPATEFSLITAKFADDGAGNQGWDTIFLPASHGSAGAFSSERYINGALNAGVSPVVPLNTWSHCVGQWTGRHVISWVNGIAGTAGGATLQTKDVSAVALQLARDSRAPQNYLDAALAWFAMYDRALSGLEIATHYLLGLLPQRLWSEGWNQGAMVTPSNTLDGPFSQVGGAPFGLFEALMVGGAGDVAVVAPDGTVTSFTGVPARTVLPVKGRRVNSTGTTATGIGAYRRV